MTGTMISAMEIIVDARCIKRWQKTDRTMDRGSIPAALFLIGGGCDMICALNRKRLFFSKVGY